jgi:O-antigen/teichoic acid export membrane protein
MLEMASNLGLKTAMVRTFSSEEKEGNTYNLTAIYQKALVLLTFSSIVFGLLLYLFADTLSNAYNKSYLVEILKLLAFGFLPFNIIDLNSGVLRGLRKIGAHSFLENLGNPLFSIIFISGGFLLTESFKAVFYWYLLALSVLALISFYLVLKQLRKNAKSGYSSSYSEILSVSIPMFFTTSMNVLDRWADILVLGFFCSEIQIAAYGLANRLSKIIIIPLQSVNSIAATKYRKLYIQEDMKSLKRIAKSSTRLIALSSLLPLLILVLAASFVISIFDSELQIGVLALQILALSQLINVFTGSVGQLLNMTEGHKTLMKIAIISTAINIVLNLILIPNFGIEGAAIATFCSLAFNNLFSAWILKRRFGFSPAYIPFVKQ